MRLEFCRGSEMSTPPDALQEYRGPGIYKHTGERIAPMPESDKNVGVDSSGRVLWRPQLYWVKTVEEYNSIWADGKN